VTSLFSKDLDPVGQTSKRNATPREARPAKFMKSLMFPMKMTSCVSISKKFQRNY